MLKGKGRVIGGVVIAVGLFSLSKVRGTSTIEGSTGLSSIENKPNTLNTGKDIKEVNGEVVYSNEEEVEVEQDSTVQAQDDIGEDSEADVQVDVVATEEVVTTEVSTSNQGKENKSVLPSTSAKSEVNRGQKDSNAKVDSSKPAAPTVVTNQKAEQERKNAEAVAHAKQEEARKQTEAIAQAKKVEAQQKAIAEQKAIEEAARKKAEADKKAAEEAAKPKFAPNSVFVNGQKVQGNVSGNIVSNVTNAVFNAGQVVISDANGNGRTVNVGIAIEVDNNDFDFVTNQNKGSILSGYHGVVFVTRTDDYTRKVSQGY